MPATNFLPTSTWLRPLQIKVLRPRIADPVEQRDGRVRRRELGAWWLHNVGVGPVSAVDPGVLRANMDCLFPNPQRHLLILRPALFLFQLARNDEHAPRPVTFDPAPGRSQQEINYAVAVHIANAGRVKTDSLARYFASDFAQQAAVLARIKIDLAAGTCRARVLPRADQQVVITILVHIAHVRRAYAETVALRFAREREQPPPVRSGMNIDSAGRPAFRRIWKVGGVDVRRLVAIHVADDRSEHCAQRNARLVGFNDEFRFVAESGVDVNAPAIVRPRARRAREQEGVALVFETGHDAAQRVARLFTLQLQQQLAVFAGEDVGAPGVLRRVIARRANHYIVVPIAVLIADARGAASEAYIRRSAGAERQQQLPFFARIDVSLVHPRRASDYVGYAVGVDVPRAFQTDAQTLVRGLPRLRP